MTVPATVGVLGGGRMGSGIAHAFLMAGASVSVVEASERWTDAALARVTSNVRASIARGTTDESEETLLGRLRVGADAGAFADADLVVEAVPEDLSVKSRALADIERTVADGAWIATNTSSIAVGTLATALRLPGRFGGLHFFNPVPASALVEIVIASGTSPEFAAQAAGWVAGLGKESITVRDSPGFASSRLGNALALEAMRMLEEGVASAADIDAAMVLGYRQPLGPLRTSDLVGLDVRLGIAEYLHETLGSRFEPPRILRERVAAGELGRKTGRGFFVYDGDERPT
jgi:3-hydroxybutyryl-CoA dehydrogenase